ncbi:hypothetical protein [Actinoplanes sp. NBRC 103695]|uniref:hypothetical protein n=1 Tax=Actinoplanes sp. NBRC 103695 TaxID=3032202 RepID=UPI0024A39CDD|nr:hypothetical protein [Actinoplanes sp. NBRC 103695]GLY99088.1 hypothetical protein Acsp02_63420 [Actinoplanes sp. NBRC 103695]
MNERPDGVETDLPDLRGLGFDELRPQEWDALESFRDILIAQIERPRINLGSGPPGRAD